MKYLIALLFSFGLLTAAMAQDPQMKEGEVTLNCEWLDQNNLICSLAPDQEADPFGIPEEEAEPGIDEGETDDDVFRDEEMEHDPGVRDDEFYYHDEDGVYRDDDLYNEEGTTRDPDLRDDDEFGAGDRMEDDPAVRDQPGLEDEGTIY